MGRVIKILLGISMGMGLWGCAQDPSPSGSPTKLVLTGSSTVAPLASELGKRFEQEQPNVRVDVQTGGSARGFADAMQGLNDLGMVSRDLKPEEMPQFQAYAIAKDGIGIIVHQDNPVDELDNAEILAIFLDQQNNWQAVGGTDQPITVVNKAEGRSTLELFLNYFEIENSQIQADVVIGDNQQGIKTVAGNPDAVGYVSIGAAEQEMALGTPIKLLPIGGVDATTANVKNGSFPLSRTLNLISTEAPEGITKTFIEFAQSPNVYDLVEAQNFVPLATPTAQQPQP